MVQAAEDLLGVYRPGCISRQSFLRQWMQRSDVDGVLLTSNQNIQYFFGPRFPWTFKAAAWIPVEGETFVLAPHKLPPECVSDRIQTYAPKMLSTMRNDQAAVASDSLVSFLKEHRECRFLTSGRNNSRIAVEYSEFWLHLKDHLPEQLVDVEPQIFKQRRCKGPDEIAKIRKAIDGTEQMYQVAREIIKPGVSELEVYNSLQTSANNVFGEPMTGTGNDYQVNSRGGSPRGHVKAEAGQLYILDLGPAFRGYFADNARTIAVSDPKNSQLDAWKRIMEVFTMIDEEVRPGVRCQAVFEKASKILECAKVGVFNHHLGHGIGLFPHEGPHLNPNWDDTFEVGDVFTAEPGLYDPALAAGMRIENDYLVTETGVENLSPFELDL